MNWYYGQELDRRCAEAIVGTLDRRLIARELDSQIKDMRKAAVTGELDPEARQIAIDHLLQVVTAKLVLELEL